MITNREARDTVEVETETVMAGKIEGKEIKFIHFYLFHVKP